MAPSLRLRRRRRAPPCRRLGLLRLVRHALSRSRRPRPARLHVRPPPRVRCGPHRRDRQHDAQAPPAGQASARRRFLLLAGPLDGRLLARGGPRGRGEDGRLEAAGVPELGRLRRRERVRDVPLDHRDPQPARPRGHPADLPRAAARNARRGAARAATARPRLHEQALHRPRLPLRLEVVAHVPAGHPLRAGLRYGDGGRAARDRGRGCDAPPSVPRGDLAAASLRGRHVADGHDRRRVHGSCLQLGLLEPDPQGVLQHHGHDALGDGRAPRRLDRAPAGRGGEAFAGLGLLGLAREPRLRPDRLRDGRALRADVGDLRRRLEGPAHRGALGRLREGRLGCRPMADAVVDKLSRNAVDVLPEGALEEKLKRGKPLRVKLGIDVTSPDIHVGRGIPLQRMRAFQDEGHKAVLIIGDYTTRIGDPSGRSAERPILSDEEIDRNAQLYLEQAKTILRDDPGLLEVRRNGEWLSTLTFADVVRLTRTVTVARLLERDDFAKRYAARQPISVSELLYPLMQAYDSVAVEADVELGGTDQLYNLLAGREVMEAFGMEPQVVLTTPLLLSWDGEKMSSSVGNNIPLTAEPEEMFGRTMRIPDSQLEEWWTLVAEQPPPAGDPMEAKLALARLVVARSHGEAAARAAEEHFTRVVREGQVPDEVPEHPLPAGDPVHLPALLADAFGTSTSEARRLIAQGGVKLDGDAVTELDLPRQRLAGAVLQAGKRRFVRLNEAA